MLRNLTTMNTKYYECFCSIEAFKTRLFWGVRCHVAWAGGPAPDSVAVRICQHRSTALLEHVGAFSTGNTACPTGTRGGFAPGGPGRSSASPPRDAFSLSTTYDVTQKWTAGGGAFF